MSYDTRIDQLLEEVLNSERTVEEVCVHHPELLGEVRRQLSRIRSLEAQVDDLFPRTELAPQSVQQDPTLGSEIELPSIQGYEILSILGRGGMGVVYRAKHLKLNRVVALKMLLAGSHASRQEQVRFVREAEAVAALRHPNIVQIHDFGEAGRLPYFTMEYVDGGSLAQKLAAENQPVLESAQMIITLAHAVFAAHESGVIHRDLKPANILLVDGTIPKISDFGLARRLDGDGGLTMTGVVVGTPSYMAPEQMTGSSSSVGPAADIFSLGAILYEMLTGRPPFRGESLSETERRLMTEDPAAPSRLNPKVPRDLETICLKCLQKDPQRRYPAARDLAADLVRFLRHEPIHARPINRAERLMRWIHRNPVAAILAVTAVVIVGFIVCASIHEWGMTTGMHAEKSQLTERLESGLELVQNARYAEARAILEKLGDGGYEDLRQRIDRALVELELVEEFGTIGVQRGLITSGHDDTQSRNDKAIAEYAATFARTGLANDHDDPKVVAQRIRESSIQRELVAALDDWAVCESDKLRRNWLLDVAGRADPEPSDWHQRVRDPAKWHDRDELFQLAKTASMAQSSVQLLLALGDRLSTAGLDSIPFRKRVQEEQAGNFLANFSLANALREKDPTEAIRFYQAALAIRPRSAPAHNNLAVNLAALGRMEEAAIQFKRAAELDPLSASVHYNLGLTLNFTERANDAIAEFQQAIKLEPDFALPYGALGEALFKGQRYADAEIALRRSLELLGQNHPARSKMADLLHRCEHLKSQDP